MANISGKLYTISTFGESHGGAVGVVVDGVPSGYAIDLDAIQHWLTRRRPGQSHRVPLLPAASATVPGSFGSYRASIFDLNEIYNGTS